MFAQFGVTNFRSIREKAVLNMNASADTLHEHILIQANGKAKLLPAAAIYGANSAGKTNVLIAIQTMQSMITGSNAQLLKEKELPYDPYMFLSKPEEPTTFEIIFYYQDIKYAYSFSYNQSEILTEHLYHWPHGREALIFSRENGQFKFSENIAEQNTLSGRTPDNRLYLVSSNEWNLKQTALAYRWFAEKLLPYDEQNSPSTTSEMLKGIKSNPLKERVIQELQLADLGISSVGVSENPKNKDDLTVLMVHCVTTDGGVTEQYPMPLIRESKGTQRFYSRIGPWITALEKGGVLLVDEIEASMHPLLTKRLVEMIQNPNINTKGAQLIFTTHDAMLLDLSLLRRDQIWFVDKDEKSLSSELFSLWDYSARKDENIQKGYLQGRYGAIPFLGGDV